MLKLYSKTIKDSNLKDLFISLFYNQIQYSYRDIFITKKYDIDFAINDIYTQITKRNNFLYNSVVNDYTEEELRIFIENSIYEYKDIFEYYNYKYWIKLYLFNDLLEMADKVSATKAWKKRHNIINILEKEILRISPVLEDINIEDISFHVLPLKDFLNEYIPSFFDIWYHSNEFYHYLPPWYWFADDIDKKICFIEYKWVVISIISIWQYEYEDKNIYYSVTYMTTHSLLQNMWYMKILLRYFYEYFSKNERVLVFSHFSDDWIKLKDYLDNVSSEFGIENKYYKY